MFYRDLYTDGEIIIFRARTDGFVQIAGPSMTSQLAEVSGDPPLWCGQDSDRRGHLDEKVSVPEKSARVRFCVPVHLITRVWLR